MRSLIDFGYSGWWMWGHLPVVAGAVALLLLAWRRRWHWLAKAGLGAITFWALAAFLVVQLVFRFNDVPTIPTPGYLSSGAGRVLDIGAGSGRSSIMVLLERPNTTLVALDNFSATYIEGHGPEKLKANLRAAGVGGRAEVVSADMRKLPFPDASFDAIVSTYAIDHLPRNDIPGALSEAARVLRPGGEFLLEVMYPDAWMRFAYGPLMMHGARAGDIRSRWTAMMETAGFRALEQGTAPATFYIRAARRKSGE
jgi:SAM-dependent methyltransferase